jgi:hypothetical protein
MEFATYLQGEIILKIFSAELLLFTITIMPRNYPPEQTIFQNLTGAYVMNDEITFGVSRRFGGNHANMC